MKLEGATFEVEIDNEEYLDGGGVVVAGTMCIGFVGEFTRAQYNAFLGHIQEISKENAAYMDIEMPTSHDAREERRANAQKKKDAAALSLTLKTEPTRRIIRLRP
jgi:hypothetical protein